jgi:1-acyl-sn-glycerol-3-phosphate acyltransferase
MTMTIHETVIIRTLMRWLALLVFTCAGWRAQGCKPDFPRYFIIAAPHTSNWDFIYTLCLGFYRDISGKFPLKESLPCIAPRVSPPVVG